MDMTSLIEQRFHTLVHMHGGCEWRTVRDYLDHHPAIIAAIAWMESTGGDPTVVTVNTGKQAVLIADCSTESPKGRRSLCYDDEALSTRKENKPSGSALGLCLEMGVSLMDEAVYHSIQGLQPFDTKTSSWLLTPSSIRSRGGALFGDHRFGRSFTYHNGAESYYAARGFRCVIPLV
jgi:Protein of unknown function (DUF4256)